MPVNTQKIAVMAERRKVRRLRKATRRNARDYIKYTTDLLSSTRRSVHGPKVEVEMGVLEKNMAELLVLADSPFKPDLQAQIARQQTAVAVLDFEFQKALSALKSKVKK